MISGRVISYDRCDTCSYDGGERGFREMCSSVDKSVYVATSSYAAMEGAESRLEAWIIIL